MGQKIFFVGRNTDFHLRQGLAYGAGQGPLMIFDVVPRARLLCGLFRIPGIGPQYGLIKADDQGPFAAGKTAEVTQIFGLNDNGAVGIVCFEEGT